VSAHSGRAGGAGQRRGNGGGGRGSRGPDPFFWAYLAAVAVAIVAAIATPVKRPGYALNSAGVYRAEIGLIFLFLAYLIILGGFLAYQGRSIGTVKLADVLQTDLPDPTVQDTLEDAKDAVDEFDETAIQRQDALEEGLEDLLERVARLETMAKNHNVPDPRQ